MAATCAGFITQASLNGSLSLHGCQLYSSLNHAMCKQRNKQDVTNTYIYIPAPALPPKERSAVPRATLDALRLRLAMSSVDLLPSGSHLAPHRLLHMTMDEDDAQLPQSINISSVCAVFEDAYRVGGAPATLALVRTVEMHHATQIALNATERAYDIGAYLATSRKGDHNGVAYFSRRDPPPVAAFRDSVLWPPPKAGVNWSPRPDILTSAVLGGHWWLKHWLGTFLAEKAMLGSTPFDASPAPPKREHVPIPELELMQYLQAELERTTSIEQWSFVAAMHGVTYRTLSERLVKRAEAAAGSINYPIDLLPVLCPLTSMASIEECYHGIGHAIFLAVVMMQQRKPEHRIWAACHPPTPFGVKTSPDELQQMIATCRQVLKLSWDDKRSNAQIDQKRAALRCEHGVNHSALILFSRRYHHLGVSRGDMRDIVRVEEEKTDGEGGGAVRQGGWMAETRSQLKAFNDAVDKMAATTKDRQDKLEANLQALRNGQVKMEERLQTILAAVGGGQKQIV